MSAQTKSPRRTGRAQSTPAQTVRAATAAIGLITAGVAPGASSQPIDYATFENLFGEPITTSANGKPQRASDVAVTMDIITAEDIRRSGALTLPGVLKSLAGIDYLPFSSNHQEIAVRGYNQAFNPRLMVLINGRQAYVGLFGFVAWDQLPVTLSEIRQIEVVRGPMTALFGFNAISGAINIVTYDPSYDSAGGGRVYRSTDGDTSAEAFVSTVLTDTVGLRLSARFSRLMPFDRAAEDQPVMFSQFEDTLSYSTLGEVTYRPTERLSLAIEGSYNAGEIDAVTPIYSATQMDSLTWSLRARAAYDLPFGQVFADVSRNANKYESPNFFFSDFPEDMEDDAVEAFLEEDLIVARGGLLLTAWDTATLRFTGEYRNNDIFQRLIAETPNDGTNLTLDIWSASALMDWQMTDTTSASLSLRYDRQSVDKEGFIPEALAVTNANFSDISYDGLSANFAVAYRPDEVTTWRASAARGLRVPSAAEIGMFGAEPEFDLLLAANPDFKVTTVDQIEAGYERRFPRIDGDLRLTLFAQHNKDLGYVFGSVPVTLPRLGAPAIASRNIGNSKAWGFEIEFESALNDSVRWGANYSFIDVTDSLNGTSLNGQLLYPVGYEQQSPKHHANAWIDATWQKWEAGLDLHFVSKRSLPSVFDLGQPAAFAPVGAHVIVDAHAAYKVTDWLALEVKATGLTQKLQRLAGPNFLPAERRIWGGLRVEF